MLDVTVKAMLPELTPFTGQNLLLLHAMKSQLFFSTECNILFLSSHVSTQCTHKLDIFYTQQPSRVSLVQKAYCSFQKSGELGVEQAKMFKDATPFGK